MNKTVISILTAILLLPVFTACSGEPQAEVTSEAQKHTFTGYYEAHGTWASLTDAAFWLVLETDGSVRLDRYAFAGYNAAPAADNPYYTASYGTGTWKSVTKDGQELLQIKLTMENEGSKTIYAEKENGIFVFELPFSIRVGAGTDDRVCVLSESAADIASADDFIQQFSRTFEEPASIAKMEDAAADGALLFFEDGTFSVFLHTDVILNGTWGKDAEGLTLVIGSEKHELPIENNTVHFQYAYAFAGHADVAFDLVLPDAAALPDRSRTILASGERDYSAVPDPLQFADGTPVQTESDFQKRKAEIVALFAENVYGPIPTEGYNCRFETIEEGDTPDGKAHRQQIRMTIETDKGSIESIMLLLTPVHKTGVPVIIGLNYGGNHTIYSDLAILPSTSLQDALASVIENGRGKDESLPVQTAIDNGYAVCTLCYNDLAQDSREGYARNLIALFAEPDMGALSAWAFGMSRCVDYLMDEETINPDGVIFVGHSRLGKAATWAAASDARVKIVLSNCSGSAGTAMTRGNQGENLSDATTFFPYWFSPKYAAFAGRENELPIDQNLLLACMADRYLCVGSAESDGTADPRGAWNALCFADNAFVLYGDTPLDTAYFDSHPFTGNVMLETKKIHYHLREGVHSLNDVDWAYYFDFMNQLFYNAGQ